jgi:hypothetical protein
MPTWQMDGWLCVTNWRESRDEGLVNQTHLQLTITENNKNKTTSQNISQHFWAFQHTCKYNWWSQLCLLCELSTVSCLTHLFHCPCLESPWHLRALSEWCVLSCATWDLLLPWPRVHLVSFVQGAVLFIWIDWFQGATLVVCQEAPSGVYSKTLARITHWSG